MFWLNCMLRHLYKNKLVHVALWAGVMKRGLNKHPLLHAEVPFNSSTQVKVLQNVT